MSRFDKNGFAIADNIGQLPQEINFRLQMFKRYNELLLAEEEANKGQPEPQLQVSSESIINELHDIIDAFQAYRASVVQNRDMPVYEKQISQRINTVFQRNQELFATSNDMAIKQNLITAFTNFLVVVNGIISKIPKRDVAVRIWESIRGAVNQFQKLKTDFNGMDEQSETTGTKISPIQTPTNSSNKTPLQSFSNQTPTFETPLQSFSNPTPTFGTHLQSFSNPTPTLGTHLQSVTNQVTPADLEAIENEPVIDAAYNTVPIDDALTGNNEEGATPTQPEEGAIPAQSTQPPVEDASKQQNAKAKITKQLSKPLTTYEAISDINRMSTTLKVQLTSEQLTILISALTTLPSMTAKNKTNYNKTLQSLKNKLSAISQSGKGYSKLQIKNAKKVATTKQQKLILKHLLKV